MGRTGECIGHEGVCRRPAVKGATMRRLALAAIVTTTSVLTAAGVGLRRASATSALSYAAVGDSITRTGATAPVGWVSLYTSDLNAALQVDTTVADLGVNGATSAETLASVTHDSSTRSAIEKAGLVTYQSGINDFLLARGQYIAGTCGGTDEQDCLRTLVGDFSANWDALVNEIRALAPTAAKRTMTIYYPVAAYDQSLGIFGVLNSYLAQMNAHILSNPGGLAAHVHSVFNGPTGTDDPYAKGYLLSDEVHPAWLGQSAIFLQLRAEGYSGISPNPVSAGDIAKLPEVTTPPTAAQSSGQARQYALGGSIALAIFSVAGATAWYMRRKREG